MTSIRHLASSVLGHSQVALMALAFLSASSVLLTGCAFDAAGDDAETAERFAHAQAAIASGWTSWTSEEFPPVVCDAGSVVDMASCRGSYCDDMKIHCVKAPVGKPGAVHYTAYTITAHVWSEASCAADEWVTGITCKDSYCGSVSLQCTKYTDAVAVNCRYAGLFSEEAPYEVSNFGVGYYAQAVQCTGTNCDSVDFEVCQMVAPPRRIVPPSATVITPINVTTTLK